MTDGFDNDAVILFDQGIIGMPFDPAKGLRVPVSRQDFIDSG